MALDLGADIVSLTRQLVDVPSESFSESTLADAIEASLQPLTHLQVQRIGNCLVAQTQLGRTQRVLLAGHIDTVPSSGNDRASLAVGDTSEDAIFGLGSCDMKGGVAVMLRTLLEVTQPTRDITAIFYDCEEVAGEFNGLSKISRSHPRLLEADMAILLEPSNAGVEAGCQGTLRVEVRTSGLRAHTARAWRGVNAIHVAQEILQRLTTYVPREPVIDGLQFREGLQAVAIRGGIAGNVVPDECVVTVNYRFAPDRSADEAIAHMAEVFDGFDIVVTDCAAGALPHLSNSTIHDFVEFIGVSPEPKLGWTDVARFTELEIPAVNFGPGDPALAHAPQEHVPVQQLVTCEQQLRKWLLS